jgi:hypothetical protein
MTEPDSCTLPSPKKTYSITFFPSEQLDSDDFSSCPDFLTFKQKPKKIHLDLPMLQKSRSCDLPKGKLCAGQLKALNKIKELQNLAKNIKGRAEEQQKKLEGGEDFNFIQIFKEKIRSEKELKRKDIFCSSKCTTF